MEVDVVYTGGKRFNAVARDHTISIDQPIEEDGSDRGMTPPEVFLSSLGSCAAYYAVAYLKARRLPADGLHVRVKAFKGGRPVRITDIELVIEVPHQFDDRTRQGLETAAERCLIHETLSNPPNTHIRIACDAEEPVAPI